MSIQQVWIAAIWLLTLLFATTEQHLHAMAITELGSANQTRAVPQVYCLDEPTSALTIQQVIAQPNDRWQLLPEAFVSTTSITKPLWCKIIVTNTDSQQWYLGFLNAHVQQIDVYLGSGSWEKTTGGSKFPFEQREVKQKNFFFPINAINDGLPNPVYFRVQSDFVGIPIELMEERYLFQREWNRMTLGALTLGMLMSLAMGLFFTKSPTVENNKPLKFFGGAMVVCFFFMSASLQGYGYHHLWSNAVEWNRSSTHLFSSFFVVTLHQYLLARFNLSQRTIFKVQILMLVLTVLSAFFYILQPSYILILVMKLLTFLLATGLLAHYILLITQLKSTTVYYVWFAIIAAAASNGLQIQGFVNFGLDVDVVFAIIYALIVALLSYDFITQMKKNHQFMVISLEEKLAYEAELTAVQNQRNDELEKKVQERTKDLANIMKELHLSNVKLRTASSIDALTGVMNRYSIDLYIEDHWQRCKTNQKPFSIAIVDADHFKQVNDTKGHDTGDACLQHLATMLTNSLTQPDMRAARYGGEEFIIVAPGMQIDSLTQLLENVRRIIASTPIEFKEHTFTVTVSIGVASAADLMQSSPKTLLKIADQALYRAKNQGRNRVEQG